MAEASALLILNVLLLLLCSPTSPAQNLTLALDIPTYVI